MIRKYVFLQVFLLAFFLCVGIAFSVNAADEPSGVNTPQIVYVQGDVSINLSGEEWISASKGLSLNANAAVKTSDDSYCDIAFDADQKNIVSVGPNSEIKIGSDFQQVNISAGRVFSRIRGLKEGSRFEIVTPQAVAGVRGTAWESIVTSKSEFKVKENTVYVNGLSLGQVTTTADVLEGKGIEVGDDGSLGDLSDLSQDDLDHMNQWSGRIDQTLGNSSTEGKDWKKIVENYDGDSSNLFEEVMQEEEGGFEGAFASGGNGNEGFILARTTGGAGDGGGIPGGDIVPGSFIEPQGGSGGNGGGGGGGVHPGHGCYIGQPNCTGNYLIPKPWPGLKPKPVKPDNAHVIPGNNVVIVNPNIPQPPADLNLDACVDCGAVNDVAQLNNESKGKGK
ncbi:MAG: FecR family protein [Candidatus Omnitrophota bacterium]